MAENNANDFEHELAERLKALDAQIKIPEIPDAQAIFERAEHEKPKTNVIKFKYIGTIAAAAVVVMMIVAVPALRGMNKNAAPESAEPPAMFDMAGSAEGSYSEEEAAAYSEEKSLADSIAPEPANGLGSSLTAAENGTENTIYNVLYTFFNSDNSMAASENTSSTEKSGTESFTESIGKKRAIDVGIESDSVSVMFYDDSGEREVLSAFWVEGKYQSSYESDGYYVINVFNAVTKDDFESDNYMPLIGGQQLGVYALSEESVYVPDTISKAEFLITVEINIESGEYQFYASLE